MPESKKLGKKGRTLTAAVFWLAVWFAVSALVGRELIVPDPVTVLRHLIRLLGSVSFWRITGVSLARIVGGFLFGTVLGLILAVLSSMQGAAEAVITPFVRIVRTAPVTSFIILAMLWVSYSLVPVLIAGLLVAPVVYMNTCEGIKETDRKLLEVGRVYRFGRMKMLKLIYIPSVMPYFKSGAITALGFAWKSGIAAEVISLPKNAIGAEIFYSRQYLETADLFAWTAVVIIISFVLEKLLSRLVSRQPAGKQEEIRR